MTDVSELVPRLRYLSDRNAGTFIGDMFGEAADALETLARDNRDLVQHCVGRREAAEMWQARAVAAESRLAKLAPVVEAARQEVASGMCQSVRLIEALAAMEAAHD